MARAPWRCLFAAAGLLACDAASSELTVTLTPWCDNSFRVRVQPTHMPASTAAAAAALKKSLADKNETDLASALDTRPGKAACVPGKPVVLHAGDGQTGGETKNGNLHVGVSAGGVLTFTRADTGAELLAGTASFMEGPYTGYLTTTLDSVAGDKDEVLYGLGQGNWTTEGGCPDPDPKVGALVVPLERNGQVVNLLQRKFHVSIPFLYSSAGYGFLMNMPGYGNVTVGDFGTGGARWVLDAALYLDFWITGVPASSPATSARPIYKQYADATGHAPPLREDAMIFWQSRLRYKSTEIALTVVERYQKLGLPVGVFVIDFFNQVNDGDYNPNPACYPSLKNLSSNVRDRINATTMFSIWPEVVKASYNYNTFKEKGCLINSDLGGLAFDPTVPHCFDMLYNEFVKKNYVDQGVNAFWLDETDGEGTAGGDGDHGYDTSYGPAAAYSNLWVGDWLRLFSEPVVAENPGLDPLVLTRGTWAGGQRSGIVLWSSDILSTFEQLASQIPLGVHSSMSGIPWWTTDVGGFGCLGSGVHPNDTPYMKELIQRWYQFGVFSPVFRTHGCRNGTQEPDVAPCVNVHRSCGANEVWSYGEEVQPVLERYINLRASMKPYIAALAAEVTATGVPTVRPLAFEFPTDSGCRHIDDQYMFGSDYLVAPVTVQGAVSKKVYFPKGASWTNIFDSSDVVSGGQNKVVPAPVDTIPVYKRGPALE